MPRQYEAMRDKFQSEGESLKQAEGKAARIYNAKRPSGAKPVTRYGDQHKGRRKIVRKLTGK